MRLPEEILTLSADTGEKKVHKPLPAKLILGFVGGAMVALGYLAYIRITAVFTGQLAGLGQFLGAAVFPIGLVVILLAGGELVTGNMMTVTVALLRQRVSLLAWAGNLLVITLANTLGVLFVAFFLGHLAGLTTEGVYAQQVLALAGHKLQASPVQCFLSGIGCNWFVGLGVWLCYGAESDSGRFLSVWFPVMAFVAVGFQHSVANLFLLFAALFQGWGSLGALLGNVFPVLLGNLAGGGVFVALLYALALRPKSKGC